MTFRQAALVVLREEGRAMTTTELTDLVLSRGLVPSSGLTPRRTMSATLYRLRPGAPIQREFTRGNQRARRGSVRWRYVGPS